jgi:hypothetical protein
MLDHMPHLLAASGGQFISILITVGIVLGLLVAVGRVINRLTGHATEYDDVHEVQGFATINPGTHELKIYHEPNSSLPRYTMKLQKRPANVQTAGGIVYVSYDSGPTDKYNLHDARFIGSV